MNALSVRHISLAYQQQNQSHTILQDFDLDVSAGEIVSLLGPSGVGKSSLLRVMAGLAQPQQGTVSLFGRAFSLPQPRVSLVFQQAALLPWLNVRDNIAFGLNFRRQPQISPAEQNQKIEEALSEVGLSHAADRYPAELSGGMAQRAALARALVRQPQVLLLDEPFSALDAVIRGQMQHLLHGIVRRRNTAAVIVTHDIDEALLLSDRIVLIGQMPGRIIATWQPDFAFPRHDKLWQMASLRGEILQSLYRAQQYCLQSQTVEFMI